MLAAIRPPDSERLCICFSSPGKSVIRTSEFQLITPGFQSTVSRLLCATSTANSRKAEEVRNCSTDEGRPLGTGLQEQVPNHLRRLCPKGKVVNAEGKGLELLGQVTGKKRTAREPLMKCRNVIDDVQNRSLITTAGQAPTLPVYGRSGIRHERWPELAVRQSNGTWEPELRC